LPERFFVGQHDDGFASHAFQIVAVFRRVNCGGLKPTQDFYPDDIDKYIYPGINTLMSTFSAFQHHHLLTQGSMDQVTAAIRAAEAAGQHGILMFDDESGKQTDVPVLGSLAHPEAARGRGRPSLGVTAREVTLLPRHWEWLASQPGGASVTLRKLVEQARRDPKAEAKQKQERTYHFLRAIAGDLPQYEEVLRALFAGDQTRFAALIAEWPKDLRDHALALLQS
jgi:hypothetical protein